MRLEAIVVVHVSFVLLGACEAAEIQILVVPSTQYEVPGVLTCLHGIFELDVIMSS